MANDPNKPLLDRINSALIVCTHDAADLESALQVIDEKGSVQLTVKLRCQKCGGYFVPTAAVLAPVRDEKGGTPDSGEMVSRFVFVTPRPKVPAVKVLGPQNGDTF